MDDEFYRLVFIISYSIAIVGSLAFLLAISRFLSRSRNFLLLCVSVSTYCLSVLARVFSMVTMGSGGMIYARFSLLFLTITSLSMTLSFRSISRQLGSEVDSAH